MKLLVLGFGWIVGAFGFLAVMVPLQWVFGTIRCTGVTALFSGVLGIVSLALAVAAGLLYDRLKEAPIAGSGDHKN